MTVLLIYLFLYAGVFVFDLLPIFKKKDLKLILIYLPVFLLTLIINILFGLGIDIPTPAEPAKHFIESLFGPMGGY